MCGQMNPHRAEDQQGEHEHLHDEREIDVHGPNSCPKPSAQWNGQCAACSALTKRIANVKNSAKPMPIIATASSRPATRNICTPQHRQQLRLPRRALEKRPPRMPKPMAVPSAPIAEDDADGQHGHGLYVCNVVHSTLLEDK